VIPGTLDPHLFAAHVGSWLQAPGPDSDVVVSCRARLARNLAGFAFTTRLEDKRAREVSTRLREALEALDGAGESHRWIDVAESPDVLRLLLRERHLASRDLAPVEERARATPGRAVFFAESETRSAMVCEEDHLRLQGLAGGFDLPLALDRARALDLALEERVEYACHTRFGYLTACPTNVGTGLRASVMLHLAGLSLVRSELEKVFTAAQRTGLAVRGMYGEGSRAAGDFYQVSNQVTLGRSETDLVGDLLELVPCIVDFERQVRRLLLEEQREALEDRVRHALGVLSSARQLATDQALAHLSKVRLGVCLGLVTDHELADVTALSVQIQRGHVQARGGAGSERPSKAETAGSSANLLDAAERDRARAEQLRRVFARPRP
jgi:protein arginine kinase